jgi:hypothetical protein
MCEISSWNERKKFLSHCLAFFCKTNLLNLLNYPAMIWPISFQKLAYKNYEFIQFSLVIWSMCLISIFHSYQQIANWEKKNYSIFHKTESHYQPNYTLDTLQSDLFFHYSQPARLQLCHFKWMNGKWRNDTEKKSFSSDLYANYNFFYPSLLVAADIMNNFWAEFNYGVAVNWWAEK